jgi:hypothetical protein
MSDVDVTNQGADFDTSLLDLSTWEVPKEIFPGEVVEAGLRWSSPEYNAATENRPAFPYRGPGYGPEGNSIQQLVLNIKRLDAVYVLPDGAEAPVIVYAGVDLERYDRKTGQIVRPTKTRSKAMIVLSGWTRVVGPLVPNPERLKGMKLEFERYREYDLGNNFTAKNVVLPVKALDPTFTYTGEVLRIKVTREDSIENAEVISALNANGPASTLAPIGEAAAAIAGFLRGRSADSLNAAILSDPNFPASARREPFISAFASGTVLKVLAENGVSLTVSDDGFIS